MSLELEEQYDKIYKYCYFKVNNKHAAEDLTQETFLSYFSQNSYINRGKTLAYLYTIAKNKCTDYFRKEKSVPLNEDIEAPDELIKLDTSFSVGQAIKHLDKEKQEILLLRFSNELGIGELAKIMNISRFAVNRRLNAALNELKGILREEDFN